MAKLKIYYPMNTETITFLHYPRLIMGEKSVEVLGGILKTLDFEMFERLDQDWAKQGYFEQTQPVFWIRKENEPDQLLKRAQEGDTGFSHSRDSFEPVIKDGMLIYYALLAVTGRLYPDPRLSTMYRLSCDGVERLLGAFERTWILNGGGLESPKDEDIFLLSKLAAEWSLYGFKHDHPIFSPLRGLSSRASSFIQPAMGILPLIVSLEGFLLPAKTKNIAQHMSRVIRHLLGDMISGDIEDFLKNTYKIRSDVIHGKEIQNDKALAICNRLQSLTGALVIASTRIMMKQKFSPNDVDELRKDWIML